MPHESGTDRRLHETLEKVGYPACQARLQAASIAVIGAGNLGGELGMALALAAHVREVATGRTLIEAYGAPFEAVRDADKPVGVDRTIDRIAHL